MNFLGDMTMIRKIILGAILVASTSALYSIDASTQTEPQIKSFISMQRVEKAIDQSARFIRKHRNSKETRIGGHVLKIAGGLWAITGSFKTMLSLRNNHKNMVTMYKRHSTNPTDQRSSWLSAILNPQRLKFTPDPDERSKETPDHKFELTPISRPPYEAVFALAAYLMYDGCYGIYNELKTGKTKNDTATS